MLTCFLFRGVYESGEHQLFLERLEERIKKHDRDIEKMCSHHYQGRGAIWLSGGGGGKSAIVDGRLIWGAINGHGILWRLIDLKCKINTKNLSSFAEPKGAFSPVFCCWFFWMKNILFSTLWTLPSCRVHRLCARPAACAEWCGEAEAGGAQYRQRGQAQLWQGHLRSAFLYFAYHIQLLIWLADVVTFAASSYTVQHRHLSLQLFKLFWSNILQCCSL